MSDCIYLQDKDKDTFQNRKTLEKWFCEEEVYRKRETIQKFLHTVMEKGGINEEYSVHLVGLDLNISVIESCYIGI
jgi:hypothetical protein